MRILFFGRKPVSCRALEMMLDRGHEVVGIVTSQPQDSDLHADRLCDEALRLNIPLLTDKQIYDQLEGNPSEGVPDLSNIDLVLSMFHQRRIMKPILELAKVGAINIHPAPLPEFQGWGVYNYAILENVSYWGATAHYMDEGFDTGPIIAQRRFDVDMNKATAYSLERMTQPVIEQVVDDVLELLSQGKPSSEPQANGRYISKDMFLKLRTIEPDDSQELIDRKIRAFWYPPYAGAQVRINGKLYTLVDESVLDSVADLMFPNRT